MDEIDYFADFDGIDVHDIIEDTLSDIDNSITDDDEKYLLAERADDFLSSMEAHESI